MPYNEHSETDTLIRYYKITPYQIVSMDTHISVYQDAAGLF